VEGEEGGASARGAVLARRLSPDEVRRRIARQHMGYDNRDEREGQDSGILDGKPEMRSPH